MSFDELFESVVKPELCTRCGICAGACPVEVIKIGKDNYPELKGDCITCGLCIKSCPGAEVNFPLLSQQLFNHPHDPDNLLGHMDNAYVAYSTDERIRASGTSGGLVTALLVHLLRTKTIDGAVVAGTSPESPCTMKGVLATTPEEIVDAAQSKYCLTSSMAALQSLRKGNGKFAVVGLPCQVHGLRKLMAVEPSLARKIYCVFGLYCHCNMEPYVHKDILKSCGVNPEDITRFNFRGGGWPGGFHYVNKKGKGISLHSTLYTTLLNVLFKLYGATRCYLCVDALSEYADLSFGDFWAHDYSGDLRKLERCTLVSQRTTLGEDILHKAEQQGDIRLYQLAEDRFSKRIVNMVQGKKNRNWARIQRMGRNGQKVPRYHFSPASLESKAKYRELMLRFSFLFRGTLTRKLALKFLFSRAAKGFEQVNLYRKKVFCNYHGN